MFSGARLSSTFRWLRRSSTLRLSLLLSLIFAIAMTVAIFFALDLGRDAILRRLDATLQAMASSTELGQTNLDSFAAIIRAPSDLSDLPTPFARAAQRGGGTVDLNKNFRNSDVWRVLITSDRQGQPIFLAVPMEDSEDALELLGGILWGTGGFVVLSMLAIGLGAGLLSQRRISRINSTLKRLGSGELSARTDRTRSVDDIDDIALQLDQTAIELERLVAQTRNLSASIAHDLRTPLARLRSQLEQLPQGDAQSNAMAEATHLSEIFDTIMRVARIEAAQGSVGFETLDLGELITEMAETFEPVIEDAGKELTLTLDHPKTVAADRQMLVQAVANLVQNALRHGGNKIEFFVSGAEFGVADDGAGVDPKDYAEIIKPMVRLDKTRASEGSGLGLALVKAVADRHSAQLRLTQNEPNGLRVSLDLAKL